MRFIRFAMIAGLTLAPAVAGAGDRMAASLEIASTPALSLSVMRQALPEGGLRLRLVIQRAGNKAPKTLVLYEGDGDDDGPGDKDFRSVQLSAFDLPAETRGVRVDFEFTMPGARTHRQIDTWLISVDDTPRAVLQVTTRRELDRSRVCHEVDSAQLVARDDGRLFVRPLVELESDVSDDDDSPIDKACQGRHPGKELAYQFDAETYRRAEAPAVKRVEPPKTDTAAAAKSGDGDDD